MPVTGMVNQWHESHSVSGSSVSQIMRKREL